MPDNRPKGGRQTSGRESDRFIVPAKAGNAAGRKETTDGRARVGNTGRTQRRRNGGHETALHRTSTYFYWRDGLSGEPCALIAHARFCEGQEPTGEWLKWCGTAGKPGG